MVKLLSTEYELNQSNYTQTNKQTQTHTQTAFQKSFSHVQEPRKYASLLTHARTHTIYIVFFFIITVPSCVTYIGK
jgi:hypothetical protein